MLTLLTRYGPYQSSVTILGFYLPSAIVICLLIGESLDKTIEANPWTFHKCNCSPRKSFWSWPACFNLKTQKYNKTISILFQKSP